MVLLTVWVTVAVVTVMLSRLLRTAAPMAVISPVSIPISRGMVDLVAGSTNSPE